MSSHQGTPSAQVPAHTNLQSMASGRHNPSAQGAALNLDDNQCRWLTVGIAINKVLVPHLRTFVEDAIKTLYQKLLTVSPPFNPQSFPNQHKTWGTCTLEYKNINNNDQVAAKPPKPHYNYNVTNHLDLSRLFLQTFMSKFNAFEDTDASALLSLVLNVDDSSCPNPRLILVKTGAQDMKEVRNEWAHCNFQQWDVLTFNNSFRIMEVLLKHIVPGPDQQCVLSELKHIEQNGHHLCRDHSVQMEVLQSLTNDIGILASEVLEGKQKLDVLSRTLQRVQQGQQEWVRRVTTELAQVNVDFSLLVNLVVKELDRLSSDLNEVKKALEEGESLSEDQIGQYCQELQRYHENMIKNLQDQMPRLYDVEKYVKLKFCTSNAKFKGGEGLDEYINAAKVQGSRSIQPEELFQVENDTPGSSPRAVVIVGVPGGGKTITSYYLLKKIVDKCFFQSHARFPFFIRFRDLNVYKPLTFQHLLLSHHGPSTEELQLNQDYLWAYMLKHQDEVTIILDGFDEFEGLGVNFKQENTIRLNETKQVASPQVLLYNLLAGHVMKKSRVILTTRPHCVEKLKQYVHHMRIVSIEALDVNRLEEMIRKDLGCLETLSGEVIDHIKQNLSVQTLCSVPINARAYLDLLRWVHRDDSQGNLVKDKNLERDKMPQTMAGLLFVLDLKMLQVSDRSLPHQQSMNNPGEILQRRGAFLQKVTKLAFTGMGTPAKQRFTDDDIAEVGLKASDLEGSIMTCTKITIEGDFGPETRQFYSFPHLINQEHLAGLHMTQRPVEEVEQLTMLNDGHYNNLFQMYLGACGDHMVTKYLQLIYPNTLTSKDYAENAKRVVRAIWQSTCGSKQVNFTMGVNKIPYCLLKESMYKISMWYESRQWAMAKDFITHLCNHHGVLRLPSPETPAQCAALSKFVDCLPRSGYTSLSAKEPDVSVFRAIQTLVKQHSTLASLRLISHRKDVWDEWQSGDYSNVRCALMDSINVTDSLDTLCQPLQTAEHLDTLVVKCLYGSNKTTDTFITPLKRVKHLQIYVHGPEDLFDAGGLCDWVLHKKMEWLHLKGIHLSDNHAAMVKECLSNTSCRLHTLRLQECDMTPSARQAICEGLTHNSHLTALDLSWNHVGDDIMPAVVHLLSKNANVQELDISHNSVTDISGLCDVLMVEDTLQVLDLSGNPLTTTAKLCVALRRVTSLRVLLMNGCDLDDAFVHQLIGSLSNNTSLKAISMFGNEDISVVAVEAMITKIPLEVLDMRWCGINSEDDQCRVVQALLESTSLRVLGWGDQNSNEFMAKMLESYPNDGPLQALYIPFDDLSIRTAAAALAEKLGLPQLVRRDIFGRDITGDTGYRWCSLPPDRRYWLLKY